MEDNHFKAAQEAYLKFLDRQQAIEDFENDVLTNNGGNKLKTKIELSKQPFFQIAVGARNGHQERARTEALMSIAITLQQIRDILLRIDVKT